MRGSDPKHGNQEAQLCEDGTPGRGGHAVIMIDPNLALGDLKTWYHNFRTGKTRRGSIPLHLVLAHEVFHAMRGMNGRGMVRVKPSRRHEKFGFETEEEFQAVRFENTVAQELALRPDKVDMRVSHEGTFREEH